MFFCVNVSSVSSLLTDLGRFTLCVLQVFADPSSEKLLPDILPPPYQRPYTLVLELNGVLIHSEYDVSVDTHTYTNAH